jgi:hypothetical protein
VFVHQDLRVDLSQPHLQLYQPLLEIRGLDCSQLLPKGEVLQDEALSGSQESGQPAEEVPKQHNRLEKCGSLKNGSPPSY